MRVILAMTRIAIRGQNDLSGILSNVAGVTIEAAMGPGQRVARLRVVVKAPPRPTIRIMAECAIRAESTLMVLIAMAGDKVQRRALECERAMAFLAWNDGVATDQRKSRNVVIEGRHTAPIVVAVTSLVTIAKLTVVPIVLAVTGNAGRPQLVAIKIVSMARVTLHFCRALLSGNFVALLWSKQIVLHLFSSWQVSHLAPSALAYRETSQFAHGSRCAVRP